MTKELETKFEPEITAFYCIYCGYMAADTAGALQVQYPANVKFVRMPCTGKTDVRYLLEAFEQGADGVYIVACPIGNCHHVRGYERGRARMQRAKKILDEIGLGGERLDMFFMSGSQAQAYANAAKTMTERVRKLGPNPLKLQIEGQKLMVEESEDEVEFRGRRQKEG
ncbi:MAG: hydrogenase iron-sulfur subunit [Chloroflexi bacterium CG_4_10_14_0_8_um_filter_57_5]|nr:MAG: hydrogenase iron-sulfur subunit [Chloroflexi bacterium CG_4_10_14_0_8_um_filter_57_5]